MYEWEKALQQMIDYLEEHLTEQPTLEEMARHIGYSPYYCSSRFHEKVGMSIRSYLAGRRLCRAALEIRDTNVRILDIALKYGYSSQEALNRAFMRAFGLTPYSYRKNPQPIALPVVQNVFFPEYYQKEEQEIVSKTCLTEAKVRVEYIPAHKYLGIFEEKAQSYFEFWQYHDCDRICGIIESMSHVADPVVSVHTAGWFYEDGKKKGYCYGMGVPEGYSGEIPEGFSVREVPGGHYIVFYHPVFDFMRDCEEVVGRVEELAWNYDPAQMGFAWREGAELDYQRMLPESIGYEVLRPVCQI